MPNRSTTATMDVPVVIGWYRVALPQIRLATRFPVVPTTTTRRYRLMPTQRRQDLEHGSLTAPS